MQVRDEHRSDYDPGRGGWGAQAQRLEIERRREVEERYMDAETGPGAVAGGGEDWKATETGDKKLKRARSEEDDGDAERLVRNVTDIFSDYKTDIAFQGTRARLDEAVPDHDAERM